MGRKSLAAQRQADILNAFEQCILERGIEGTSFQHIAQVLDIDRKMVSHYFGNRETLVDAMAQRIVDGFDSRMHEALENLDESDGILELIETFYEVDNEQTEILWAEISAYGMRSPTVRLRLRQSYDMMFDSVSQALKRDYPKTPKKQLQITAYMVMTLLDRSTVFEWLGVKGSPIASAKAAIKTVLKTLE